MLEIRPDAVSLWLINLAWFCVLGAALTANARRFEVLLVAGALAGLLSLGFSARAAIVSVGLAVAMLVLVVGQRQWRAFYLLAAVGIVAALIAGAAWRMYPAFLYKVYVSAFVETRTMMPVVPLTMRLFLPTRLALIVCILGAFGGFWAAWRAGHRYFAAVAMIAGGTQLALIFLDPSPFEYVYGYATVPCLAGWLILGDRRRRRVSLFPTGLWITGVALTAVLATACAAYGVVKHKDPPAGSNLRLRFDRPLTASAIAAMPTERLVAASFATRRQDIFDDIAIRSALCARLDGKVLVAPPSHPICLADTSRNWSTLPAMTQATADGRADAAAARSSQHLFEPSPVLIIWGTWADGGAEPPGWIARNLGKCYQRHPGFALLVSHCQEPK